jgi:hypothetical protein
MKRGKFGLLLGTAIAALILFSACHDIFEMPELKLGAKKSNGNVTININGIGGGGERTVLPKIDQFDNFRFTFSPDPSGADVVIDETGAGPYDLTVDPGDYTLKVEAQKDISSVLTTVASGNVAKFTINATGNPTINVKLSPSATTGTGSFVYTITHQTTDTVTVTMKTFAGVDQSPSKTTVSDTTTGGVAPIAAGSYEFTVKVEDSVGKYAALTESVIIYAGIETAVEYEFDGTGLITPVPAGSYRVIFNKNNTDATGATEANPRYQDVTSGGNIVALTSVPTRTTAPNVFTGWNSQADGLGVEYSTTTGTVSANMILYAQWATPSYSIDLFETATTISLKGTTKTFTAASYNYATAPAEFEVDVKNTGNVATGALTVTLTDTNAGSFDLLPSGGAITTIAAGATSTAAFSVQPKTGLNYSATAYTATVTVSGGNGITATFNVSFTVNKAVITDLVIKGLEAPVTGGTPDAAITNNTQYTLASITWDDDTSSGWDYESDEFEADTVYIATITLTAGANYTFTGVAQDAFEVDGSSTATVENSANTGVVTVTFDATASAGSSFKLSTAWADDEVPISLSSTGTATLGNTLDLSVTLPGGYTAVKWVEGAVNEIGSAVASIKYTPYEVGTHKVTFFAKKGDVTYSSYIDITVSAP